MFAKTGLIKPERKSQAPRSQARVPFVLGCALLVAPVQASLAVAQQTEPSAEPPAAADAPGAQPSAATDAPAGEATAQPATEVVDEEAMPELETSFDLLPLTPTGEGGLTGEYVKARAVEVSGRARSATAQAEVAEAEAGRAISIFAPRVNLTARYTRLSDINVDTSLFTRPMLDPMTGQPILDPVTGEPIPAGGGGAFRIYYPNNYSLKGTIRVPVSDYFLNLFDHYDSAQTMQSVQLQQARGEHQAVAHEAMRDYIALARAVGTQRLAEYRVGQIEQFVEETRVLVEGGERGRVDLALAQARLASAKALAANARANLNGYKMGMRVRLELDLRSPIGVAEPLTEQAPEPPTDLEALLRKADAERPELVALRELIVANRQSRDAAAGSRYPSLALFGEVELANPNQRYFPLKNEWQPTWAAGVELTWSPNDLAIKATELDRSELEVVKAENQLRDLRARVASEVTNAYEAAVAAAAAVDSSEVAVASAEETARVQLALYQGGEATSRSVLDAEVDLREAQLQWLDNVLNAHLSRADLQRATGQLKF